MLQDSEITIRNYKKGDEKEIINLIDSYYIRENRELTCSSLEHWTWKYLHNKINSEMIQVAEINNKIVGVTHTILSKIKIFDEIYSGRYSTESVVDSNYRKMGIWRKLLDVDFKREKEYDVKFTFFSTRNPIVANSQKKRYPYFFKDIKRLTRIDDFKLHIEKISDDKTSIFTKIAYNLFGLYNNVKRIDYKKNSNIIINQINEFDETIDDFINSNIMNYDFIIKKDQEYLNWRYCDPRAGSYKAFIVNRNEKIVGYFILDTMRYKNEYKTGYIIELFADQNDTKTLLEIIGFIVEYYNKKDINVINIQTIKNSKLEKILTKYGFISQNEKIHLFYKSKELIEEMTKLESSDPSKVFISYGDIWL